MNRSINVRLAAALLPLLFAAAVLGISYVPQPSSTADSPDTGTQQLAAAADSSHGAAHFHATGIQECSAGPSKCTGQPALVSASVPGDSAWSLAAPSLARELFTPGDQFASQDAAYRLKPPPRMV